MEPDEGQGCGAAVPAVEVDQNPPAATAVSDVESPHADNATCAEPVAIHDDASQNEDEKAAGQTPETTDITVSPHTDPQLEASPQTHTDPSTTDFPESPTVDKGKQPQSPCYTPGLVAMDEAALPEAPPPLSSPPQDFSSVHVADHFSDPSMAGQGKEQQQFYYSSDPIVTEASSSSTIPTQPVQDIPSDIPAVSTAGLAHGQPVPWELDPERPAQKLPIRFKDVLGRTILIPWRRAKTWDGMKMTIDAQFMGFGSDGLETPLGNAVVNGRYSLNVSLPSSIEPVKRKSSKQISISHSNPHSRNFSSGNRSNEMAGFHEAGIQGNIGANPNYNSNPGGNQINNNINNGIGNVNQNYPNEIPASHMRPMIILPEFWDELIQPGSHVTMLFPPPPRVPYPAYEMMPPNLAGIPPAHGVGMMNQPMPPMAPLPPRIFRVIDSRDTRPKTRPSSGRPRKRV